MAISPEMIQVLEPKVVDFKAAMLRIEGEIRLIVNDKKPGKKRKALKVNKKNIHSKAVKCGI